MRHFVDPGRGGIRDIAGGYPWQRTERFVPPRCYKPAGDGTFEETMCADRMYGTQGMGIWSDSPGQWIKLAGFAAAGGAIGYFSSKEHKVRGAAIGASVPAVLILGLAWLFDKGS